MKIKKIQYTLARCFVVAVCTLLTFKSSFCQPTCSNTVYNIKNYIITNNNKWVFVELETQGLSQMEYSDKHMNLRITEMDINTGKRTFNCGMTTPYSGNYYADWSCACVDFYKGKYYRFAGDTTAKYGRNNYCFKTKMIALADSSVFIVFYLVNSYFNTYYVLFDKNRNVICEHVDLSDKYDYGDEETYRKAISNYALKQYPLVAQATGGKPIWNDFSGQLAPVWCNTYLLHTPDTLKSVLLCPDSNASIDSIYVKGGSEYSVTNAVFITPKWRTQLVGQTPFAWSKPLQITDRNNNYYIVTYDCSKRSCYTGPDVYPMLYVLSKSTGDVVKKIELPETRFNDYINLDKK